MREKGFASILVIFVAFVLGAAVMYFYQNQKKEPSMVKTETEEYGEENISPPADAKVEDDEYVSGKAADDIQFTLPSGWTSKLFANSLNLYDPVKGGYVTVFVYKFPEGKGRRDFYCEVSAACLSGATKFTEFKLGNISGYEPSPIDNSGGGPEFFGSKGDKFYRVATFCPPTPESSDCNKLRLQIMDSLVF